MIPLRFFSNLNLKTTFAAGATGAERGGTGADREAGSGVEEHPGSDGEEDAQSRVCRQTGGETQGRHGPFKRLNVLSLISSSLTLICFTLSSSSV